MRSLICTSLLSIFIFLFSPAFAEACSCISSGPPCQSYWDTPVVFSGRVIEIKSFTDNEGPGRGWQQRLVRFAVDQAYRGISGSTVEVITGAGGGDCGYGFVLNESYLVYAHTSKDKFYTGICSRTQLLSKAGEDLEYINNLSKAKPGATIYGAVSKYRRLKSGEEWRPNPPLPNIRLTVEGKDNSFEAITDEAGKFRLGNLASGDYTLRLLVPAGFHSYESERKIKIHEKGCSVVDFTLEINTSLSGRILNENSEPAAKIMVNLISVEQINERHQKDNYFVQADENGRFTFRTIPDGKYYLGVRLNRLGGLEAVYPRTFYPGTRNLTEAAQITISEGQVLENYNFQLPPRLTERKIEGTVVFPDGKPVPNAFICFEEVEYAESSMCYGGDGKIEADGRFSFTRLNGLRYLIRAHVNMPDGKQRHAEPVETSANGDIRNVKLIISEPNGSCEKCRMWKRK